MRTNGIDSCAYSLATGFLPLYTLRRDPVSLPETLASLNLCQLSPFFFSLVLAIQLCHLNIFISFMVSHHTQHPITLLNQYVFDTHVDACKIQAIYFSLLNSTLFFKFTLIYVHCTFVVAAVVMMELLLETKDGVRHMPSRHLVPAYIYET